MSGRAGWSALLVLAAVASVTVLMIPGTSGAFVATITNSSNTAGVASRLTCAQTFATSANRSNAYFEYALSSSSSSGTAADSSTAGNGGSYQVSGDHPTGQVTATTACPNDSGYFYAPNGSSNWIQTANPVSTTPATFTLAIWFQTTKAGGYLIGLNASQTATDPAGGLSYDRHLYVDTAGKLVFGTYSGTYNTIASSSTVNDGKWHQAVATMSAGTGMSLWVDGVNVANNTSFTSSEANTGYWRIAEGPLQGWPNAPSNTYFQGGLRFAAVYKVVLSNNEIAAQWANGRPGA